MSTLESIGFWLGRSGLAKKGAARRRPCVGAETAPLFLTILWRIASSGTNLKVGPSKRLYIRMDKTGHFNYA